MSLPESLSATGAGTLEAIVRPLSETLIATDFDGNVVDNENPIPPDPPQIRAVVEELLTNSPNG